MNVVCGLPPNFKDIVAVFPDARRIGVIFAYGDTVYVNGRSSIPPELRSHEAVHLQRQNAIGVDVWWQRYLADLPFRLEEEVMAHRAEYGTVRALIKDRNQVAACLDGMAKRLASPLYGKMISYHDARRRIVT